MRAADLAAGGYLALARGDWEAARDQFEAAREVEESAAALDGLARALWWLGDAGAALQARAGAYALMRASGADAQAAAIAVWLARQHRTLYRRDGVADGWLARASSLTGALATEAGSLPGWLCLARAEASGPATPRSEDLDRAISIAEANRDPDLGIIALATRGAVGVARGDVAQGRLDLNEAMATATSGEGHDVQYVGEALCILLEVAGWIGDPGLVEPWAQQLVEFRSSFAFGPLLPLAATSTEDVLSAFCAGCCGGVYMVVGRVDAAVDELVHAVAQLVATGLRPRCLHPVAELVQLRVLQGRLGEAEATLVGFEDDLECAVAAASLHLARHRPAPAVRVLETARAAFADRAILALPLDVTLVDAALAASDLPLAQSAAARVQAVAAVTGSPIHRAYCDVSQGRIALAEGGSDAAPLLRSAALGFASARAGLPAARARLDLARAERDRDRGLAITEARAALLAFERTGASAEADVAAAVLRELGDRGRSTARSPGVLSKRELTVLTLIAEGLTNAEIAERLVISVKTAGNHVSSILLKLGLRSRTEAATYALLRLPPAASSTPGSPGRGPE